MTKFIDFFQSFAGFYVFFFFSLKDPWLNIKAFGEILLFNFSNTIFFKATQMNYETFL